MNAERFFTHLVVPNADWLKGTSVGETFRRSCSSLQPALRPSGTTYGSSLRFFAITTLCILLHVLNPSVYYSTFSPPDIFAFSTNASHGEYKTGGRVATIPAPPSDLDDCFTCLVCSPVSTYTAVDKANSRSPVI